MAGSRLVHVLGDAAHVELDAFGCEGRGGEPGDVEQAGPFLIRIVAEGDGEFGAFDGRLCAGHGQEHRLAGRVGDRGVELQAAQEAVRCRRETPVELECIAGEVQPVEADAARIPDDAVGKEVGFRAEEIAELRRNEPRDRPAQLGGKAVTIIAAADIRGSGQHTLVVGVECQRKIELVERAGALQRHLDWWLAFDVQEIGDDSVRRLRQRQVEVEFLGFVGVLGGELEFTAGTVEAVDIERRIERAVGEVEAAGKLQLRAEAEDALAEGDLRYAQFPQLDRDRQLGQLEAARFRSRHPLFGQRLAQHVDLVRGELVDVEAAEQECGAVPVDRSVDDLQPDALPVGYGDLADGRARGEHAADA